MNDRIAVLLAEHLDAEQLAHLAAARRMQDRPRRPRLSPEAADELTAMLVAGRRPGLGWWRERLRSAR